MTESGPAAPPTTDGMPPVAPDRTWRRGFLTQLLIAGLSVTALQAARPMVTYRALELGASPLEIGLVVSAFSILPVLTAVPFGRWVDRFGEVWFLVGAMALISLGSLVSSTAATLLLLGVGNAIAGLGQITSLVAGQAMIGNRGPRDRRAERYGWYSTVASLGQLLGPAIAALLVGGALAAGTAAFVIGAGTSDNAVAPVFLFGTITGAVCVVLALTLPRRAPSRATPAGDEPAIGLLDATRRVLRRPGMLSAMAVSITVISAVDVLIAYLPVYGQVNGLPVEIVALLLSVRAGASLVSRLFMTQLIDRVGRERLLALSMVMAGLGIAALPFTPSVPILFGLMILIGLGLGLGQPMTIAWVADRSPRSERALALGVRLTGNRGALLVVPTVMGAIAGASGITAIWVLLASFLMVGANVARRAPSDAPPDRRDGPRDPVAETAQDGSRPPGPPSG